MIPKNISVMLELIPINCKALVEVFMIEKKSDTGMTARGLFILINPTAIPSKPSCGITLTIVEVGISQEKPQ